ncbi:hypothetical protein PBRA_008182 [Plasmodiophora brassicae]|uniref:Uncharacterized protein n=1 Tax=Plasmodiophora brassicae TaxID=37360 RepID=A0A0G4IZW5_PLABS|nr:hypothetical protein PBRA_008182 [Plasmodiophora brassicae]
MKRNSVAASVFSWPIKRAGSMAARYCYVHFAEGNLAVKVDLCLTGAQAVDVIRPRIESARQASVDVTLETSDKRLLPLDQVLSESVQHRQDVFVRLVKCGPSWVDGVRRLVAERRINQAIKALKLGLASLGADDIESRRARQLLADVYLACHRPALAERVLRQIPHRDQTINVLLSRSLSAQNRYQDALDVLGDNDSDEYLVQMAACLAGLERWQQSITVTQDILRTNPRCSPALLLYAREAARQHRLDDAIPVLVKLVLTETPEKEPARQCLARSVSSIDALLPHIGDAANVPSALAFLGDVFKTSASMPICVDLYSRALSIQPDLPLAVRANLTLTLVHALETVCRHADAFDRIRDFFDRHFDALPSPLRGIVAVRKDPQSEFVPPGLLDDIPRTFDPGSPAQDTVASPSASDLDLDLLALAFTAVKLLFLTGELRALPSMIAVVETVRPRGLHTTTIRNEHAYYCCVVQLLHSMTVPLAPAQRRFHVIADSHGLSSAWRVCARGRMFIPHVITGVKCWHLRPSSTFFTKSAFWASVDLIPPGADVIVNIGEIDCRDGMIRAVEHGYYDTMNEAIEATVQSLWSGNATGV